MKKSKTLFAIAVLLIAVLATVMYLVLSGNRTGGKMTRLPRVKPVDMGAVYVEKNLFRIWGGLWRKTRESEGLSAGEDSGLMEKLRTLPYVEGSQAPAAQTGITVYDPDRASDGFNLYTSAHLPVAALMDMDGSRIHTWLLQRDDVWPRLAGLDQDRPRRYFRRAHLYENGDLLVIYEYTGIVKMDRLSKVKWSYLGFNHHDMFVDDKGAIYVLGRDVDVDGRHAPVLGPRPPKPRRVHGRQVFDENITVLGPRGTVRDRVSLVDCLENSEYAYLLDKVTEFREEEPVDLIHPNTVQVMDGSQAHLSPFYKKGNVLTSFRNLSTIAIVDMEARKVVWALTDAFLFQHDPRLLGNGHMMVFDNYSGGRTPADSFFVSSVIEFDPFSRKVFWAYTGDLDNRFFSSLMGTAQPLPNGNVLITESDFGRAFEVTRDGDIVWQFNSPHLQGEEKDLVATLPELQRLSPRFPIRNFKENFQRKLNVDQ